MENKVDVQCNKIFHLEDSMVLYGIYNSDTLENVIDTVDRLHNQSTGGSLLSWIFGSMKICPAYQ